MLTHEDFSGSKKYEGFDIQANIDLTPRDADGNKQQQPDQTSQPKNSAEGTYQLNDTRQGVRATVGPGEIIIRDKDKHTDLEASGRTEDLAALNRDPDKAYEIIRDKHVEIEYYLSNTSVKAALEAGQTWAETFGNALDQMVKDGKRTPEQAALSKEMFPFLDDRMFEQPWRSVPSNMVLSISVFSAGFYPRHRPDRLCNSDKWADQVFLSYADGNVSG